MIERIVIFTCFLFLSLQIFAQEIQVVPKVNKRIELVSTVFRLAGANEYVNNELKTYTKEVDAYFEAFKKHKIVKLAKKARLLSGVSFDAVASLATSIEIKDNRVQLQSELKDGSLDDRWKLKKAQKFVEALNDFYQVSKFDFVF
jgi:hypothetical protein